MAVNDPIITVKPDEVHLSEDQIMDACAMYIRTKLGRGLDRKQFYIDCHCGVYRAHMTVHPEGVLTD